MASAAFDSPPPDDGHVVLFYDDDTDLHAHVSTFVAAGLATGESVLVFATPDHRAAFRRELEEQRFDVDDAIRAGQLTMLDARETLSMFMLGGAPDATRFARVIGGLLESVTRRRPHAVVRAYGEMVDLLCRDGQAEAAINLEQLWNGLARSHRFSLFCTYVKDSFSDDRGRATHSRVCATHARVLANDNGSQARLREIAALQRTHRLLAAEADERDQTDAFRLLVETVQDHAIFMLDPRGIVATWNAGARRIKGYSPDEIIGQHFSRFYPESDVKDGKCEQVLKVAAAEGRFEDQGWRLRKDGTSFWANVVITALHDTSGTLVGYAKVTRDLTERRRAEEERIRLARAEEANRVKDEFLAMVSHELRTPLNAILGWAMVLQANVTDPQDSKGVATIVRNAQAQVRLIDDLLDVARIVNGKLRLEVGSVDLRLLVGEAIDVVRPTAEAKQLTLALERPDHPVIMLGDQTRLKQVIWNLLTNAVKFTDRGGSVSLELEQEKSTIRIIVRDTGRGIEPDFLPYLFERFRQEESSPSRRTGGLGLGLAIVRHLVQLHGGKVEVHSGGKNKGSTFTVTMPVSAAIADASPLTVDMEKDTERLDGLSVLVVEDEVDSRDLISMVLEDRGAKVTTVASVREARAWLETSRPSVIVSDIGMPNEDGFELIRSIRKLPRERGGEVPVVALTVYASPHERRRALDAGFNNHISKPVNPEELASVVRNAARFAR